MEYQWKYNTEGLSWTELSQLYKIAPLGDKHPDDLKTVFDNSRFKCFVFDDNKLIGAGRGLADGRDCSYLCDVAVHPEYQGRGLGRAMVARLVELSAGHSKIVLYSARGKEDFYKRIGFRRLITGMAIFEDYENAVGGGIIEE